MDEKKLELYLQSMISELVKLEKDMRGQSESLLAIMIEMIELNRLTLKTLQVQFNVFLPNPRDNINPLEKELDEEIHLLEHRIGKYKDMAKKLSGMLMLPSPSGNGEVTVNE
jgi:hypothetical protein